MNKRKAKKLAKRQELYGDCTVKKRKTPIDIELVTKYLPLLDEVFKKNEEEK